MWLTLFKFPKIKYQNGSNKSPVRIHSTELSKILCDFYHNLEIIQNSKMDQIRVTGILIK